MILYFSATGNNKYCAEFIASRTNDEKIISLNDLIKNNVSVIDCEGIDKIGLVAPTYDFDLAYVVADFLENLEFKNLSKEIYFYGIFTCGSMSGNTEGTLREILKRKGIKLNAAFVVVMPDNYVLMFKQKNPEIKTRILAEADEKLKEISDFISAKKNTPEHKNKIPKFLMWAVKKFMESSQKKVKGFSVNENCIGCGLCEKICPMNIIKIQNNKPVWTKDNCACCLACLHRCPKQAINRGKSEKNGRYINPNVNFNF